MKAIQLAEIIDFLEEKKYCFELRGACSEIQGFSSLVNYKEGSLTWKKSDIVKYDNSKRVSLCIVQDGVEMEADAIIIAPNSKEVFFSVIEYFYGEIEQDTESIGIGTVIGRDVKLGKGVRIGSNCSIIGNIEIGSNTLIGDNVVIRNYVTIGKECTIQSLTVIGEDGFGYSEDEKHIKKMVKHYGGVQIGDDVFIGSHVNIARGTIDDTVIKRGVKIAPSTHIGHNNIIDANAAIICSQLFGSVKIEENAYVTSSVVRNQCSVGKNAIIGMGSVVTKNIEENKVAIGTPAKVIRENLK